METVSDYFGCLVFDERVMKAKLSSNVYRSLHGGKQLCRKELT